MDAGAKKEDVDVLVKSSFYLVGKGPWTTINRIGATVPLTGQGFGVLFLGGAYLPQK
jgi:hypothetical protein